MFCICLKTKFVFVLKSELVFVSRSKFVFVIKSLYIEVVSNIIHKDFRVSVTLSLRPLDSVISWTGEFLKYAIKDIFFFGIFLDFRLSCHH